VTALAVLGLAAPARADDSEDMAAVGGIAVLAVTDLRYTVHAAVLAANDGEHQFGVSLAQTIVGAPQAIALNGLIVGMLAADNDGDEVFIFAHAPTMLVNAMTAHGIWALAVPDGDPALMFMASAAIGVNTMWTSFAIGSSLSDERQFGGDYAIPGIYEIVTTAPGVAVGIHQALETDAFTTGWVAISAWSGVLAVHGAIYATGALGEDYDDEYESASPYELQSVGIAPTSFGPPVEGAPHTPGMLMTGMF
jgi:hypothetical protein